MIYILFAKSHPLWPHRPGEWAEVGQSIGLELGTFAKSFEDGLISPQRDGDARLISSGGCRHTLGCLFCAYRSDRHLLL